MNKNKVLMIGIGIGAIILLLLLVLLIGNWETNNDSMVVQTVISETATETEIEKETTIGLVPGVEIWDEETEAELTVSDDETVETTKSTTTPTTAPTTTPTTKPTTAPTTAPTTEPTTKPTEPAAGTYEWYMNLSAEEQEEYYNSLASPDAFFEWFNAAKEEYEDSLPFVEISGSPGVNLEEILGGKG